MTSTIGAASIALSVDSSGVETGMTRVDAAVTRTGRTLATLGQAGAANIDSLGGGAAGAAMRIDNATRSMIGSIQRTAAAMDAGERNSRSYFEALANQRGIDANVLRPYLDQLDRVRERQAAAAEAARASGAAFGGTAQSAAQLAANLRSVPAQFTDIITSLQGGQRPLTVFLQQGGQLRDMFGSAGGAARALGGYVVSLVNPFTVAAGAAVLLASAYNEGSKEAQAYNRALILTGNVAGTTSSQLTGMAANIAKQVGTQSQAADALAQLAGTGKVGVENLQKFGATAVLAQKAIGTSVADTVGAFAELGKSPLQASEKLNEQYHYLTLATYEQIKALTDQGKTEEAATVAQNAYADAITGRGKDIQANLGLLEKSWNVVGDAAKWAWDQMLNVGREDTFEQKLEKAQAALEKAQRNRYTFAGGGQDGKDELDRAQAAVDALKQQEDASKRLAAIDAERIRFQEAGIAWDKEGEKFLTRRQQLERDILASRNKGLSAGVSDAEIAKREFEIRKQYADIFNAGIDGQIEAIKRRGAVEDIVAARSMAALTANRDAGLATSLQAQFDYAEKAAAFDIAGFTRRKSQLQEELALTKGKANSEKDQADLRGQIALTDEQIASRKIALEKEIFVLDVNNTRAVAASYADLVQRREDDLTALKNQVLEQRNSNALIGLSKGEIADYRAALVEETATRMESRAAIIANDENRKDEAETLRSSAKALRELAAAQHDGAIKTENFDLAKKQWESIDQTAHDVFVDIFNGGKSAFDRLRDTLKSGLLDLLYQMTVKKWIFQIGASVTGFSGLSNVAQAQGLATSTGQTSGLGDSFSAVSAASSLYKAISGGFAGMEAGISTTVADGVQSALYATGQSSSLLTNSAFANSAGQMAGSAASNLAGIGIGHMAGNAISGDYSVGNHGQAVVNISAVVGSILGGPIGGAIGGAVGGLLNRAFGMGPEQVTSRTLAGTLSNTGASGNSIVTTHQDGGWFRGDKNNTVTTALTADVANTLAAGFSDLKSVTAGFAKDLGASSTALDGMSKVFNIALTEDATKNQEAIAAYFKGLGDELAVALVPTVSEFSKAGESAAGTLQRLAGEFETTTQVATLIGKSAEDMFGSVGIASAKAREQLLNFAGGAQQLSSQATFFAENFLTDAEKLAPVAKSLDQAMASLGLSNITTRDQFKALVQGLDSTTEAGAKEQASLLALAEAFAQVHPKIEATTAAARTAADVLAERVGLQNQLDEATMTAAQLLEKQRNALDDSNRSLFDQVQLAGAAKAAAEAASQAAADAIKLAQESAAAQMRANAEAMQSFANGLASTMTAATEAAKALRDFNTSLSLGSSSTLSDADKRQLAKQQFEGSNVSNIQANATAFLEASKNSGAGSLSYARDFAEVQAALAKAAANQDKVVVDILNFYRNFAASGGIGAHANGGVASGWSLVGEQGPELVNFTNPGRVYTADQSRSMMGGDTSALRDEIRQLRADLSAVLGVIATNTGNTTELIDRVTDGGSVMVVESI